MNFVITRITSQLKSFDDDGVLYFEGLSKFKNTFEPLYDFVRSSGCTEIQFLENNQFIKI